MDIIEIKAKIKVFFRYWTFVFALFPFSHFFMLFSMSQMAGIGPHAKVGRHVSWVSCLTLSFMNKAGQEDCNVQLRSVHFGIYIQNWKGVIEIECPFWPPTSMRLVIVLGKHSY